MERKPKVSVIMPSFNVVPYIQECMESVIHQTLQEIEIICVDAGSTDGTLDILREYAEKDDRIKIILSDQKSYGHQMNLGIAAATGDYIGIVETDDYVDLTMFQTLYKAAENDKAAPDIVKSVFFEVRTEQGRMIKKEAEHLQLRLPKKPFTVYQYPDLLYFHPSTVTAIYRREFLEAEQIRYVEAPGAGWVDNPFFIATMCLAKSIVWVPECLYYYRQDVPGASSYLKDCTIPFHRLTEIFDFIETHGIEDQKILTCLYKRAFIYLRNALNSPYYDRENVRPLIQGVMRRMKGSILNDKGFNDSEREQFHQYYSDIVLSDSKNEFPEVSVIIPVYNAQRYLRECLDSVINQTITNIEIICVDDGSTDYSRVVLQEYRDRDSRIKLLFQENAGSGAARNNGISSAAGKYIAFMDADDYYPDPAVLETMVKTAESNDVRICGGGVCENHAGKIIPGAKRSANSHYEKAGIVNYREVQYDYGYQRYIFERKMLEDNNIIFPDYLRFQDPPFFVMAMLAAGRFYALDQDVYCYRNGHQRIVWTNRKVNDLICGIRDVYELAIENDLDLLAEKCLRRINFEYKNILYTALKRNNNQNIFCGLMKLNVRINDLRQEENLLAPFDMLLDTSHEKEEIKKIYSSKSYQIGRFITWLPRKVRGGIRCYQEHGLRYTLRQIKKHLLRR